MGDQQAHDVMHKMAFDAIGFAAQLLTPQAETLETLIRTESRMHSYLHITDPTLYGRAINDKGLAHQVRLAKAALAFILEVQVVKAEINGGGALTRDNPQGFTPCDDCLAGREIEV